MIGVSVLAALVPAAAIFAPLPPVALAEGGTCGLGSPEYYRIELVSTGRVPGSGRAEGVAELFYADSPFGVSIALDGSYMSRIEIAIEGLAPAAEGQYVVWLTTPTLDQVEFVGALGPGHRLSGQVLWNKFLVVISLERDLESLGPRWSGPIVLRGMSRSGMMHTMAGHGPFEDENCASVGYN